MVNPFVQNPLLSTEKRGTHTYIIGQPGTGKSRLMESWIMQDIQSGQGICVIDPHGDLFQTSWLVCSTDAEYLGKGTYH